MFDNVVTVSTDSMVELAPMFDGAERDVVAVVGDIERSTGRLVSEG